MQQCFYFFNVVIDDYTQDSLIQDIISKTKYNHEALVFANHNFHSLYLCLKDRRLDEWINSQYAVFADGMGIVYLGKLFRKPLNRNNRITYVDLMPTLLQKAQSENCKIFYLGATQKNLEIGLNKIRSLYPMLNIVGHNGFELENVVDIINYFKPDILFVGMGMPIQEKWIMKSADKLDCKIILPCGAAIDYYASVTKIPPRWAGRIGLEWLYRLLYDPKRLWKRYILEPFYILMRLILWKVWK